MHLSYPTMLHSEQKCAHFCSEWSIVGYGRGAFWDLWIRSSALVPMKQTLNEQVIHFNGLYANMTVLLNKSHESTNNCDIILAMQIKTKQNHVHSLWQIPNIFIFLNRNIEINFYDFIMHISGMSKAGDHYLSRSAWKILLQKLKDISIHKALGKCH